MRREEVTFLLFATLATFAACTGGEFQVGSGSGATSSSTSAGQGGATSSSTTTGDGGGAVSSSASGTGGEASSTTHATTTSGETATSTSSGEGGASSTSSSAGSGGAGGGVMDTTWCEANGASFNFCSDFDEQDLLVGWTDFVFEPGLTGTPNTLQNTSPPVSFKVSSQAANNGNWGVVEKDLSTTATFTTVEFDFYFGGSAFQINDLGSVDIATIVHGNTSGVFGLDKMGFYVRHLGAVDIKNPLPDVMPNTWTRVGLTVVYSSFAQGGEVGVSYDGVGVGKIPNVVTLMDVNSMDISLFLGQMRLGSGPSVDTSFDNVTWLVNP